MRRSLLRMLAPLALVLFAASAHAQGSAPSRAEQLFREGRAAADTADYKTACARFAESERLEPAPGTLLNVADCEEHLGQLIAAIEHFNLAASGFRRDDTRRAYVANRAAQIEKRLAHVTLHLAQGVPAEASITKGGLPLDRAALDKSMPADPGAVTIVVSLPGHANRTTTLALKEGQALEATLDVGEVLASAPSAPATAGSATKDEGTASHAAPAPRSARTIGFVLGGAGALGLATGAVFGVLALSKASTVKAHCDASLACDQQGVDAASSGKTFALVSTIAFPVGAVLLGAGAYLVLTSGGRSSVADARPGASSRFVLTPYASPYGAGAASTWVF